VTGAAQMLTVRVPLAVRKQRGGRKLVLTPGGVAPRGAASADTTLVKALARAFRWRRMLESGRYSTIKEMAAAEKMAESYLSRILRLTLLAPDIVEAILDGRQQEGMTLPGLMEPFPCIWVAQRSPPGPTVPVIKQPLRLAIDRPTASGRSSSGPSGSIVDARPGGDGVPVAARRSPTKCASCCIPPPTG